MKKKTVKKNGVELEKREPSRKDKSDFAKNGGRIPPRVFEERRSVGYMPADPIQQVINYYPPVSNVESLRKDWTDKDRIKNATKVDNHRKEKQTKEAQNLKEIIGTPTVGSSNPYMRD